MKEDVMEWMITYGWIPILILAMGFAGFIMWIIIKLLQHFTMI